MQIDRAALLAGLRAVAPALAARTAIPVLSGVLLHARGDRLRLAATDMEISLETTVPLTDGAGAAVVPGHHLLELVGLAPDGGVTLEIEDAAAVVRWPGGRQRIPGWPADQFPSLDADALPPVPVPQPPLAAALKRAMTTAARGADAPVLCGVHLQVDHGTLHLTATDRARVSLCDVPVGAPGGMAALISAGAAKAIAGLPGDTVALSFGDRRLVAEAGGVRLTARLIDGRYPNVRAILPPVPPNAATADRDALLAAIQRAALLAGEGAGVRLTFAAGQILVAVPGQDAEDVVPASGFSGAPMPLAFDAGFLQDGLRLMDPGEVRLAVAGGRAPLVMHGVSNPNGFVYALLPLTV